MPKKPLPDREYEVATFAANPHINLPERFVIFDKTKQRYSGPTGKASPLGQKIHEFPTREAAQAWIDQGSK
jgi:hypothetical protein